MDRPLKEHIAFLEHFVEQLNHRFMENALSKDERNRLQSEIRAAEMAVDYYRKALDIEHTLMQS
jgi:hypothetical protein